MLALVSICVAAACSNAAPVTAPSREADPAPITANTGTASGTVPVSPATSTATTIPLPPASAPPPPLPAGVRYAQGPCDIDPPDGYDLRCGRLTVPENRSKPNGLTVTLHVGIFHKQGAIVAPDPIVFLDGGPGGHSLEAAELGFVSQFAKFAERHDIVIFDQRGTGFSEPALDCPNVTGVVLNQLLTVPPAAIATFELRAALKVCFDDLRSSGRDPAQYNSVSSAADVADLRQALGFSQWNLLGVSYGTRLGLTVLRLHPEGVRSVILDSTYPPEVDAAAELPDQMAEAFQRFFEACVADAGCNTTYPNLETRFNALVAHLDETPLKVQVLDVATFKRQAATLDGPRLQDLLFLALYEPLLFRQFPRVIQELESSKTTTAAVLMGVAVSQLGFLSIGAHVAVQCHEELAFTDPAMLAGAIARHPELAENVSNQLVVGPFGFDTCAVADAGRAESIENQAVISDVPTLVLSGELDPVTPSAWGRGVAAAQSHGTFVSFKGLGHGVSFEEGCPNDIARAFLESPSLPVAVGCTAAMTGPRWLGVPKAAS